MSKTTPCWRSECRVGCYYPDVCSERTTAPHTVAQPAAGPTTHAPVREPQRAFRWPCMRRDAHDPHPRVYGPDCPGVMAHPFTMIGGGYKR